MKIKLHLIDGPLRVGEWYPDPARTDGALVTFAGHIRPTEDGRPIAGIGYEVYEAMVEPEVRRICGELEKQWPVSSLLMVHRRDMVHVREAAVFLAVAAPRRREAFRFAEAFMDRLKQDVPIWKDRIIPYVGEKGGGRVAG